MGFLDKARGAAKKAVDQHGDKIGGAIDKGASMADKRTGGKHRDTIRKAQSQAKTQLDKLDGENDDIR